MANKRPIILSVLFKGFRRSKELDKAKIASKKQNKESPEQSSTHLANGRSKELDKAKIASKKQNKESPEQSSTHLANGRSKELDKAKIASKKQNKESPEQSSTHLAIGKLSSLLEMLPWVPPLPHFVKIESDAGGVSLSHQRFQDGNTRCAAGGLVRTGKGKCLIHFRAKIPPTNDSCIFEGFGFRILLNTCTANALKKAAYRHIPQGLPYFHATLDNEELANILNERIHNVDAFKKYDANKSVFLELIFRHMRCVGLDRLLLEKVGRLRLHTANEIVKKAYKLNENDKSVPYNIIYETRFPSYLEKHLRFDIVSMQNQRALEVDVFRQGNHGGVSMHGGQSGSKFGGQTEHKKRRGEVNQGGVGSLTKNQGCAYKQGGQYLKSKFGSEEANGSVGRTGSREVN